MKTIVVASTKKSCGKTSIIAGLAGALGMKAGYLKPFGDRLLYQKKRLWDYDSALITGLWNLRENPQDMSIGFEHAKLKYVLTADDTRSRLNEMVSAAGKDKEILFIEAGKDLAYGISVNLDPLSMARAVGGKLLIVAGGDEGTVVDDIAFLKRHINLAGLDFCGAIINKVPDPEDFKTACLPEIAGTGIPILGMVPRIPQLTHFSMRYLSDVLFAKIIAGEDGLDRIVKNIVIGAMTLGTATALGETALNKEDKLVITSGDRSDMVLAALDGSTAGVILTNNILPPSSIITRASQKRIPVLLVAADTFQAAKMVDDMEPLLAGTDTEKARLLAEAVRANVDLKAS